MNGCWPEDFKVSLEVAKSTIVESNAKLSDLGLLSPC